MVRIVVPVVPLGVALCAGCSFDGSGPSQLSSADLATHETSPPQLVLPVRAAKQVVLRLGGL